VTVHGSCQLRVVAALLSLAGLTVPPAAAADIEAGREKAQMCAPCHGMDGLSKAMDAPHIAGQLESYLVRTLKGYKTGERKNEQMSIIAENLTDEDIADLAAYYTAIKITVDVPE
jgi:cytochrome c553